MPDIDLIAMLTAAGVPQPAETEFWNTHYGFDLAHLEKAIQSVAGNRPQLDQQASFEMMIRHAWRSGFFADDRDAMSRFVDIVTQRAHAAAPLLKALAVRQILEQADGLPADIRDEINLLVKAVYQIGYNDAMGHFTVQSAKNKT